ncbi:MAG: hypothetical protein ACI9OJ_002896 [Myxococcota bacterium]|jgi:uncharacterized protein (AIM24 family)
MCNATVVGSAAAPAAPAPAAGPPAAPASPALAPKTAPRPLLGEHEVVQSAEGKGVKVEVLAYRHLAGTRVLCSDDRLYYEETLGRRAKRIKWTLSDTSILMEPGLLHFMKGHLTLKTKAGDVGGVLGLAKGLSRRMLAKETIHRNLFEGTGEIHTEPTMGHYIILRVDNETYTVDKGMYCCSEATLSVKAVMQKNVSSGLFGGEGLFQTEISGDGLCVLTCPVPVEELVCYELNDDRLSVDGTFAVMRTGDVTFSVKKAAQGFYSSATSGEGMLQTFEGTGKVWIAPTLDIYQRRMA